MAFKALVASKGCCGIETAVSELEDTDLMDGDVTVNVEYSTINYKDGLALSGKSPVIAKFPLIAGIDLAGTVESSSHAGYKAGDKVVLNGWALSQTHHGGYAQRARVRGDWLVKLPEAFTTRQAMAIGTAGYTAMLCVLALERGGVTPDKGPVLVTGANGGVGSIAIALLAGLGYQVMASTGRMHEADYLKTLGAADIIERASLSQPGAPISSARWAGAVDSVGSHTLVNVLAQTRYGGTVAACGLAQGPDLPGSVLPFILRGVTLAGVDSVNAPFALRQQAWERLARDLDPGKLESTTTEVGLADVPGVALRLLQGNVRGRTVVDVNR